MRNHFLNYLKKVPYHSASRFLSKFFNILVIAYTLSESKKNSKIIFKARQPPIVLD